MQVTGIGKTGNVSYNGRLRLEDIVRLPSPEKNIADYYQHVSRLQNPVKKKTFWRNTFTALTFGLTGLYLAHRNNLFNPIRREAKKIIKNRVLKAKVSEFVDKTLTPETYIQSTKEFLEKLSKGKLRTDDYKSEAKKILKDKESFDKLYSAVAKQLADDPDPASLKRGYTADMLDQLFIAIEKDLNKKKNHGLEFKNQGDNIIEAIFEHPTDKPSLAKQTLLDIIENRSAFTIENFVKDSLIQSRFSKAVN